MLNKILVGLTLILSIIQGLAGDMIGGGALLLIVLVIIGIVYGISAVDAEDATDYLVVTIAVGAVAGADVLSHIPLIGAHLDAILDPASVALYASVASILGARTVNRLKD